MAIREVGLTFKSLAELKDGLLDQALKLHLQRLSQDCLDRPGTKGKRKCVVELVVNPVIEASGECREVSVTVGFKSQVPAFESQQFAMRPVNNGLNFNRDFPEELSQQPLGFESDDGDDD